MHEEYYGAPSTSTTDYLAHYGVLGMKWGIRRAAKKGMDYQYKSHATKKYEKAAAKLAAKAKEKNSEKLAAKSKVMANRAKRSKEVDRGEEEFARGISTGKVLGISALGGSNALKAYAQHRAMSGQKGKEATGAKGMAAVEAIYGGTAGSRTRKAGYIRQDEKRKGLNAAAHRIMENSRKTVSGYVEPAARAYESNKPKTTGTTKKKPSGTAKTKKANSSSNSAYMEGLKKASQRGGIIGGTAYAIKNRKKR